MDYVNASLYNGSSWDSNCPLLEKSMNSVNIAKPALWNWHSQFSALSHFLYLVSQSDIRLRDCLRPTWWPFRGSWCVYILLQFCRAEWTKVSVEDLLILKAGQQVESKWNFHTLTVAKAFAKWGQTKEPADTAQGHPAGKKVTCSQLASISLVLSTVTVI